MIIPIFASHIDHRWAPERLSPGECVTLQWMDVDSVPGAAVRAKGSVRGNFTSGLSNTAITCGVFQQRNGAAIMVYQDLGGSATIQVKPQPNWADSDY